MFERFSDIMATPAVTRDDGAAIGLSREGRPVRAFRFGSGSLRISLLGGCHADEPVGPRLLRHLAAYLSSLTHDDPMLAMHEWWIVPHANPDGEVRNRVWYADDDESYEIARYLPSVVREKPGDDIEFGFPRDRDDDRARPETRAVYNWWCEAHHPFHLHATLHGMAFAAGPWFLIDEAWKNRIEQLKARCTARVRELGYTLHDAERHGEKGFFRLARGFCTRPDSTYMQRYFREQGDEHTAGLFRPSSMETIRSFGGDPLTLVSEMPLFLTPGVGVTLGPPDPVADEWRIRIDGWRARLADGEKPDTITTEAARSDLEAMPVRDQMDLQWMFITAGIDQTQSSYQRASETE